MEIEEKDKLKAASKKASEVSDIARANVELVLKRGERLGILEEKAEGLEQEAHQFHRQSRELKLKSSGIEFKLIILSFLISITLFTLLYLFLPNFFKKISLVGLVGSSASIFVGWVFLALMALALGAMLSFIAIKSIYFTPSFKPSTKLNIQPELERRSSKGFQSPLSRNTHLKDEKKGEKTTPEPGSENSASFSAV